MIVLHGGLLEGSFCLWAESSNELPKDPAYSPFNASPAALLAAAVDAGLSPEHNKRERGKRKTQEAIVWLPSGRGPIASADLLQEETQSSGTTHLAPWIVTTLPLTSESSVHLLAASAGKRLLHPGVVAGADLLYWSAALRFAAGLVLRGQFLPGLSTEDGIVRARWTPVVSGPDAARLHALAAAMPPVARAIASEISPSAPEIPAQSALLEFLGFAVDALVRSSRGLRRPSALESVHDQWMDALASSDAVVRAGEPDLAALSEQLQRWNRPIQISASAPFRLCFRLEEPSEPPAGSEEDSTDWLLRYLLQGTRDPSLLLSASQAWHLKPRAASPLGTDPAAVREHLLSSLGQASAICSPVEESLREKEPEACTLDPTAAHHFLLETAPALEQAGFGVMLPAWWTRGRSQARLKARAHVRSPALHGGGGLSFADVVQFDWQLALGDEAVSHAELTALARLKTPLVKFRGQWVEVNAAEIKSALEFLKETPSGTATLAEIVRMSVGADASAVPVELEKVTATGWIADLLAQLEGAAPVEELPPPPGLQGSLRPYQRRGYSWMQFLKGWGLGACLADDMGLGKTIQALALLQHEYAANGQKPVLLVCPTSVVGNWQKEAQRFTPDLRVLVHHGTARHRGAAFEREVSKHAIVLSSYALLHRDLAMLEAVSWSGIILDEAQNIKNPETKQARAVRSLTSGWRIALTGTPVENNVGDLWSLMEFLNPGFLGTQAAFKKRFFIPIQVYADQDAAARLRRITGPFILRRLKTDRSIITDLPEKQEMKVFCTLTKEQASLYAAVVRDAEIALESAEGISRKGLVLATLSKLKQVCNHPAQFLNDNSLIQGRSGKLARLTEMIEETLQIGDRSLIFTQFKGMGDLIRRHLQDCFGTEVMFLHGGTPKKQRDVMVERFAEPGGPSIFLLSLKAGGTGLNLTRASHVFHYDRWWNPAVENQATDRAFRIGQMKNVQVHKFVCAGTLEDKIDEMIEHKKGVAGRVVGTGEGWLTELSNAELKSIFALRREAIAE